MPERNRILAYLEGCARPRTLEEIAEALAVPADRGEGLSRLLRDMVRDGQLLRNRRGGYGPVRKMDLLAGRVQAHPDGYGFFAPDEGEQSLFLPARQMRGVLHGDRILARITGEGRSGRPEGMVVEVLERANRRLVGRYRRTDGIGLVVPDNSRLPDIVVPHAEHAAAEADYVVVEITRQPEPHAPAQGRVVEVLSAESAPELAVTIIIRSRELPCDWPAEVRQEMERLPSRVERAQHRGRKDLRGLPLVTIDGEDAQDFDDGVHCEPCPEGGWRLRVAIADVSHYVRPHTALDREARRRGTSVYFPNRVLPMLPEALANDLCSLRPGKDRLCLSCELRVGQDGQVLAAEFSPALIRSAARLSYADVAAMMEDGDKSRRRRHAEILPNLSALYELFRGVRGRRQRESGLLDFDIPEMKFAFDKRRRVCAVRPQQRRDSHRLIEECMLLANVAAAQLLQEQELPALYRVHDPPTTERLQELRAFLGRMGLTLAGGKKPTTADYARLLRQAQKRGAGKLAQTMILRSMSLAIYSGENRGHFGLGFASYAHFTSPIRRYPDLWAHRLIRRHLGRGGGGDDDTDPESLAGQCSLASRRAEEAERDMDRWCKCDYLRDRSGEEFDGTVSGVCAFGLFVELQGLGIDGLVHVTALPSDYYHYDPAGQTLRGEHRGKTYRLLQQLRVRLLRVDMDNRRLDLTLAPGAPS